MTRHVLSVIFLLSAMSLGAVVTENSASLNALCGITALSGSVSDYAMSPVIGVSGFSSSFCSHFGSRNGSVFGFHAAANTDILFYAAGISYTSASAYRWQDQYLSLSLGNRNFGLGYTQHYIFERVGNGNTARDWTGDIGFKAIYNGYGSEISLIRIDSPDQEVRLTTVAEPYPGVSVATSYIWERNDETRFATATSYDFDSLFSLQVSWQTNPSRLGFGARVDLSNFELGYSIRTHPDLNLTHAVDIGVRW